MIGRSLRLLVLAVLIAALCVPGMVRPQAALAQWSDDDQREQALEAFEDFGDDVGALLESVELPQAARKAIHGDLQSMHEALADHPVNVTELANGIAQFSSDVFVLFQAGYITGSETLTLYSDVLILIGSLEQIGVLPEAVGDALVGRVLPAVQKVRESA